MNNYKPSTQPTETLQCCVKVPKGSTGFRTLYAACARRPKVQRDGRWYCAQHDPVAVENRREQTLAKWRAETEARDRRRRLEDAAPELLDALKGLIDFIEIDHLPMNRDALQIARTAIAKAEGSST